MRVTEHKLVNGIKFFIKHTNNVGLTKLFKLLYFWDFIHFEKFGTSVTGFSYYTYPFGPVPKDLYNQVTSGKLLDIIQKNFNIIKEIDAEDSSYPQYKFYLKEKKIDLSWLSPNEKKVMEDVATMYKYSPAYEMSDITHLKSTPYDKTKREKGMNVEINYFLSLSDESTVDKEEAHERFSIQKELLDNGRL